MPPESKRAASLTKLERRALKILPTDGASDRRAQVLTGDPVWRHAVDDQLLHAAGLVARRDAKILQRSSKPGGRQRALQVRTAQLRTPLGHAPAAIVLSRRQVGHVLGARPHVRWL